jgi:hypothetical protein
MGRKRRRRKSFMHACMLPLNGPLGGDRCINQTDGWEEWLSWLLFLQREVNFGLLIPARNKQAYTGWSSLKVKPGLVELGDGSALALGFTSAAL